MAWQGRHAEQLGMPGLHDEVCLVEMRCVVRSWPPVHELGVYVLVGLYLLRQILIFMLVRLKCTRRLGLCYDSGRRIYGHTKRA